jgi:hypothetical protein
MWKNWYYSSRSRKHQASITARPVSTILQGFSHCDDLSKLAFELPELTLELLKLTPELLKLAFELLKLAHLFPKFFI